LKVLHKRLGINTRDFFKFFSQLQFFPNFWSSKTWYRYRSGFGYLSKSLDPQQLTNILNYAFDCTVGTCKSVRIIFIQFVTMHLFQQLFCYPSDMAQDEFRYLISYLTLELTGRLVYCFFLCKYLVTEPGSGSLGHDPNTLWIGNIAFVTFSEP
jgi:hypothetical protein